MKSSSLKKELHSNYDKNDIFWRDFTNLTHNPYKIHADLGDFKVLFVYVIKETDLSRNYYPISFGYMSSLLRMNGASVTTITLDTKNYNPGDFSRFDLIGFYPMAALLSETLKVAQRIKKDHSNSKICFFNSEQHQHEMLLCSPKAWDFAQSLMEEHPFLDYVLIGESESSFVKLCEKLASKNNDLAEVPACFYRVDGQVRLSNRPIEPVNFEFLPYPSRDFLEKSISKENINMHSFRIQSSRGCVSPCLFCAESSTNITEGGRKSPWLGRDIFKFVDEIELLSKHYNAVFFNIIDSSFEDPGRQGLERTKSFCEEIINRDISASFKIHLRVETVNKLDDNYLRKLKDAGIDILVIGVESGVDRELQSYKKIAKVEENIEAILRLDEMGIFFPLLGYMMFGPCLSLEDLPTKVNLLKKLHRDWDYLNMSNNILVYHGTAYHDFIQKRGLVRDENIFSGIVTYDYEDERVEWIARAINNLKNGCSDVIKLQNLLYDALNIAARYSNKMNEHLWHKSRVFKEYKTHLDQIMSATGDVYRGYFFDLIELAKSGWSSEREKNIYQKWIQGFCHQMAERTELVISNLINSYECLGLSTSTLYLKTWLSLINSQVGTSSGGIKKHDEKFSSNSRPQT